jgi:hypothetical protein
MTTLDRLSDANLRVFLSQVRDDVAVISLARY